MGLNRAELVRNDDRVFHYQEYRALREKYGALPKTAPRGGKARLKRKRITNLAAGLFRLRSLLVLGAFLFVAGVVGISTLRADTARMAYAEQEIGYSITSLQQSIVEEIGKNASLKNNVFATGGLAGESVVYPSELDYIVRTNIPDASDRTLVEELYPLSKEIITVVP